MIYRIRLGSGQTCLQPIEFVPDHTVGVQMYSMCVPIGKQVYVVFVENRIIENEKELGAFVAVLSV